MATYEYICLACERPFEHQRSMTASVDTRLACPACGSDRLRRRFSFVAATPSGDASAPGGGVRLRWCLRVRPSLTRYV